MLFSLSRESDSSWYSLGDTINQAALLTENTIWPIGAIAPKVEPIPRKQPKSKSSIPNHYSHVLEK